MKYFEFEDYKIPLTCITGFSYNKSGNIIPKKNLLCACNGINPIEVQIQMSISAATCYEIDFIPLVRKLSTTRPHVNKTPSMIILADEVILPQLRFMLTSVNVSYQSDRLCNLLQMDVSWTLSASRVVKDENRNLELQANSRINEALLPKVVLHCKGKSIECAQDINVCNLILNGTRGHLELLLADTYTSIARETWLADVNNDKDSYFEISGYGKFYILESSVKFENWLTFDLTKFSKEWYKRQTKTFIDKNKQFTLYDVFPDLNVKSNARFRYYQYDDTPLNVLKALQDSLGFLIGVQNDTITLYDVPDKIESGLVTYDFPVSSDIMTAPISMVCVSDGVGLYFAGDDSGESVSIHSVCRIDPEVVENVLKYARFNQNMITLEIPYENRIHIGSIVDINTGGVIKPCVCTEYSINFLAGTMLLELHYSNS